MYHCIRPRRDASQSVFYHNMCQNVSHQSQQHQQMTPWSEPSTSRINSQKHAVQPPPANQYTYLVLSEKLKHDSSSESTTHNSDSDATKLYSSPSEPKTTEASKSTGPPKGKFVTKTFGVKSPAKNLERTTNRKCKCPKCEYLTDSSAQLNAHYKNSHELVVCDHYSLSFSTPSTLQRHLYTHKDLKFWCNKCPKKFPFASDLRVHQVKHETKHTHKCAKCPKLFFMKGDLLRHTKIHNKKLWKCSMCDYTCQTRET